MRAAMCRSLGPPEGVTVEDVDAPALEEGKVRVRIEAASVNFPDVLIVAGDYQLKVPPPFVPGSEFAGVVVESGERVFGSTLVGAFAQELVVARTSLTPTPDGVTSAVAAAFGVAHRTAYHVLRSVAGVESGDTVVVLGAGGGVGLAAVQLATQLGAEVIAVASSEDKLAAARAMGAARTVNHREQELRAALKGRADVVVDPVGGDLSEPALRSLRYGGRFVTVGYASGVIPRIPLNLVLLKGVHVLGFQFADFIAHRADERARDEAELMALLRDGRAFPHIGARFALDQAAEALRYVADGRAVGKVVLEIS